MKKTVKKMMGLRASFHKQSIFLGLAIVGYSSAISACDLWVSDLNLVGKSISWSGLQNSAVDQKKKVLLDKVVQFTLTKCDSGSPVSVAVKGLGKNAADQAAPLWAGKAGSQLIIEVGNVRMSNGKLLAMTIDGGVEPRSSMRITGDGIINFKGADHIQISDVISGDLRFAVLLSDKFKPDWGATVIDQAVFSALK